MKILLSFFSLILVACTASNDVEIRPGDELKSMTAGWEQAFNTSDSAAMAKIYASDAIMFAPNTNAVKGRDAIVKMHANDGSVRLELNDEEAWVSGDLGFKRGRYMMKVGNDSVDEGHYLEIWRRIDGQWQIYRDIYNSSLPAPD